MHRQPTKCQWASTCPLNLRTGISITNSRSNTSSSQVHVLYETAFLEFLVTDNRGIFIGDDPASIQFNAQVVNYFDRIFHVFLSL